MIKDKNDTQLDIMAKRVVDIAGLFNKIRNVNDVQLEHLAACAYVLDVEIELKLSPKKKG
jgi:hypothetical protein